MQPGGWANGVAGAEVTIPMFHQRTGDKSLNRVVEYTLTFYNFPSTSVVHVYDNDNTRGVSIHQHNWVNLWRFTMDSDLRIACLNSATQYHVMALYEKPEER